MAAGAAGVRGAPVADISWLGAAVGSAQGLLGSAQIEDVLAVGTGRDIVLVPMAGEGAL